MPTREGDAHVKLTDQAYTLLTEMAKDYNVSQKEIASEAIILLTKRESKDRELRIARANVIQLEEKIRDNKLSYFGAFLLGTIVGGCLGAVCFGVF